MSRGPAVLLRGVTALLLLTGFAGVIVDARDFRGQVVEMAAGRLTADRISELQRRIEVQEQLFGSATPETRAEFDELTDATRRLLPYAALPAAAGLLVVLLAVTLGLVLLVRLPNTAAAQTLALLLGLLFAEDFGLLPATGAVVLAQSLLMMVAVLRFATLFPRPLSKSDLTPRAPSGIRSRLAVVEMQLLEWRGLAWTVLAAAGLFAVSTALVPLMPRLRLGLVGLAILMVVLTLLEAVRLMRIGYRTGTAEQKRSALWVIQGFIAFSWALFIGISLFVLLEVWRPFESLLLQLALQELAPNLLFVAGFGALTLSIAFAVFYRGAMDPGLMIRKTTLYGAVGVAMVGTFVAIEGFLSAYIVDLLGFPQQAGGWLAGSAVALLFSRVRDRVEKHTNRLVDRLIPATALAESERRAATIVFSDLVGFTRAAAEDEARALTSASLFHAASRESAERHQGRLVKTIGDAVLLEFANPHNSVMAALDLRLRYEQAAAALGMQPMPIRTGINAGEVVHARDGDLFGDAVNTASRLEQIAGAGCIVVSDAVADHVRPAAGLEIVPVGTRVLRGVREPVPCYEIRATTSVG
jgi:class 3 adenylate cyclase